MQTFLQVTLMRKKTEGPQSQMLVSSCFRPQSHLTLLTITNFLNLPWLLPQLILLVILSSQCPFISHCGEDLLPPLLGFSPMPWSSAFCILLSILISVVSSLTIMASPIASVEIILGGTWPCFTGRGYACCCCYINKVF